jgi:hypothetical protein
MEKRKATPEPPSTLLAPDLMARVEQIRIRTHKLVNTALSGGYRSTFRGTGLEFVSSIPKSRPFDPIRDDHLLFKPQRLGSRVERLAVELAMVARGSREGGFFIMIGRKPE